MREFKTTNLPFCERKDSLGYKDKKETFQFGFGLLWTFEVLSLTFLIISVGLTLVAEGEG